MGVTSKVFEDFYKLLTNGMTSAQAQFIVELVKKYDVDQEHLSNVILKKPEAIGFKKGDKVIDIGYSHLRPKEKDFEVYEVTNLHLDCLTDVRIRPVKGGESRRTYHRNLIKVLCE